MIFANLRLHCRDLYKFEGKDNRFIRRNSLQLENSKNSSLPNHQSTSALKRIAVASPGLNSSQSRIAVASPGLNSSQSLKRIAVASPSLNSSQSLKRITVASPSFNSSQSLTGSQSVTTHSSQLIDDEVGKKTILTSGTKSMLLMCC